MKLLSFPKITNIVPFLVFASVWVFVAIQVQIAQAQITTVGQNQYKSPADDLLSVDRITVSPFFDNADGIYARPLEEHLTKLVSGNHRFNFIRSSSLAQPTAPEEFERNTSAVMTYGNSQKVDSFFSARISKLPSGTNILLDFFLVKDGTLLVQGELKNLKNDSIDFLKGQMDMLAGQILARLPYSGRVMSREGLRVTVNLGSKDGLKKGDELTVVQIVKLNRHPKFNFLISSDKEVIGKIRLLKVEPTLSFAAVTMEKEKGVVERGTKIDALGEVRYQDIDVGLGREGDITDRADSHVAFGDNPREWRPLESPVFGRVQAKLGLLRFNQNMDVTGVGTLRASNQFAPIVDLDGEVWLTPEWTVHAGTKQALVPVKNPRTHGDSSQSLSAYELLFGYRFRFGPTGPASYVEPYLGYFRHKLFTDNSQPEAFTTMDYTGFKLGVMGEFPVTEDLIWTVGGRLSMALNPSLSESPVSSGRSSKNTINQFQVYGSKAISSRVRLVGAIDFEQYSTNFSGAGTRAESATTSSLRYMAFTFGGNYSF